MDFISAVWDWMGKNAGQIQIIIAIFALTFAIIGYKKILEQITLSKEQAQETLKVNILELLHRNLEENYQVSRELEKLISEHESLYQELYEIESKNVALVLTYLQNLKNIKMTLHRNQEALSQNLEKILSSEKPLTSKNMNNLYRLLMYTLTAGEIFKQLEPTLDHFRKDIQSN